jgi:hypothetical protein
MPRDDGEYSYITTSEELRGESKLPQYKKELGLKYLCGDRIYIVHKPRFKKIRITYERLYKTEITNLYNYYTESGYHFYNDSENIFTNIEAAKKYAKEQLEECKIKIINRI